MSTVSDKEINEQFTTEEWTLDDLHVAEEQGWWLDIAINEIERPRIQKRMYDPYEHIFKTDEEATAWVTARAAEGDELCAKAVRLAVIARLEA